MKRFILIVGGLLFVVVVALVIFVFAGLGHAIKAVVEGVGSKATGTAVTLKSADVSLTSGEGRLTGLVVGNPKGYGTPSAFELGDILVKLDTSTVTSDTIVIKEVVIEKPVVTYEMGPGGSNIAVIQSNVEAFAKSLDSGGAPPEPAPASESSGKKFVIQNLYVRSANVGVSASFLGGTKVSATMKEIHLRDVGKAEGGATSAEIAEKVLGALTDGVADAIEDVGIKELSAGLKSIEEAGGGLLKKAKDLFGK
jgi:hypothetical protein